MSTNDTLPLETLLQVREQKVAEMPEGIVRQCYEIQRRFQFSRDRMTAIRLLERLIDERVTALASENEGDRE